MYVCMYMYVCIVVVVVVVIIIISSFPFWHGAAEGNLRVLLLHSPALWFLNGSDSGFELTTLLNQ